MKVKFIDFSREYNFLKKKLDPAINSVCKKGSFILGNELSEFEQNFADYCGVKFGVGVNSGTASLFLALLALGIGKGDQVIVPSFTYIATALAVSFTQAEPVFCDIREDTFGIDIKDLKRKIGPKTKAVIPVHLYGQPADMDEIIKLARKYNLKVVEDCAQAQGAVIDAGRGARSKGRKVGSFGDLGCFSFYPTKNLGCYGDGGMIVTNSKALYKKILMLRDYGRESKYKHKIIGYNSRLDTIQAAILNIKLNYLDSWNDKRRELAHYYNKFLEGIDGIVLPQERRGFKYVYHVYVIRIRKKRALLMRNLARKGIQTIIHYPIPCHLQPCYKNLGYKKGDFPVSEKVAAEVLSLPLYPFLRKKELEYIAQQVRSSLVS